MADVKKRDDYTIDMNDMGRSGKAFDQTSNSPRPGPSAPILPSANNPILPILSYCGSSILMTVTNKYVLSGFGFNLNLFLLAVQVSDVLMKGRKETDHDSPLFASSRYKYASPRA